MTKEQFRTFLQGLMNDTGAEPDTQFDAGDMWRDAEDEGVFEEAGIAVVMDHIGHDIIFRLEDGMLASGFKIGIEDETVWVFSYGRVRDNMRDYSLRDLDDALGHARVAVMDLEEMMAG